MQPQFTDEATRRRLLLREAAFREARAAEAARLLAAQSMYDDPILDASLEYSALARSDPYASLLTAPASLGFGLSGPPSMSAAAGILPTAAGLPISAFARERALQAIAQEEAMLAARRQRLLAQDKVMMMAASHRNLAHEEAMMIAATRERALLHEEAILGASRGQALRANLMNGANAKAALWAGGAGMMQQAPIRHDRREIIHDSVEDEAMFKGRKLRSGKFTSEEDVYGNVLIELFDKGLVDAEQGISIRSFLAKALHCIPMRVTKKMHGYGKGSGRRPYGGRKYISVLQPEYQYYSQKFQAAREVFLRLLNQEWEKGGAAFSDDEDSSSDPSSEDIMSDEEWKNGEQQLAEYYRAYGVGEVPIQNKYKDLRRFILRVRNMFKKNQHSVKRIAELDAIGFRRSSGRTPFTPFERRLAELRAFRQRFGHCRVPQQYNENPSLGFWASDIRARYHNGGELPKEQIAALNAIGFEWQLNGPAVPNLLVYQAQRQGPFVTPTLPTSAKVQPQLQQPQLMQTLPPLVLNSKGNPYTDQYWAQLQVRVEANLDALDKMYKKEEAHWEAQFSDGNSAAAAVAQLKACVKESSNNNIASSGEEEEEEEEDASDDEASLNDEASYDEFPDIDEDICDDEYYQVVENLKALDRLYQDEAAGGAESSSAEVSLCSDDGFSDEEYQQVKKKLKKLDRKLEKQAGSAVKEDNKSLPIVTPALTPPIKRGRGRPKGSKNKVKSSDGKVGRSLHEKEKVASQETRPKRKRMVLPSTKRTRGSEVSPLQEEAESKRKVAVKEKKPSSTTKRARRSEGSSSPYKAESIASKEKKPSFTTKHTRGEELLSSHNEAESMPKKKEKISKEEDAGIYSDAEDDCWM